MKPRKEQPLILCLGDADRGDEAVGPCCADRLDALGLTAQALHGEAYALLEAWRGAPLVVIVDATQSGTRPPGAVLRTEGVASTFDTSLLRGFRHRQSLGMALRLGKQLRALPERLVFYGVEAEGFEWGAAPSPRVIEALDALAEQVAAEAGPARRKTAGAR